MCVAALVANAKKEHRNVQSCHYHQGRERGARGVFASRSAAQMLVELGETIGYYSPVGSFQSGSAHSLDLPRSPSSLSGTAFGGDLRLWVGPRLGLELAGST